MPLWRTVHVRITGRQDIPGPLDERPAGARGRRRAVRRGRHLTDRIVRAPRDVLLRTKAKAIRRAAVTEGATLDL
jgi:hypothetical protein